MKENKIEKLILDLSNRWECTPQEVVDRLNSMDESEINKLIKDMVKKFQPGGPLEKDIVFPERPHTFIPSELEPVSRRDALQKYQNFGYNRRQARKIYNRTADYIGRDNAAKWMSAAWDQRAPGQTGYLVPVEGQLPWEKAPAMQPGIEMPITNSDPQYIDRPRNFRFKNGGFIDEPITWDEVERRMKAALENNWQLTLYSGQIGSTNEGNPFADLTDSELNRVNDLVFENWGTGKDADYSISARDAVLQERLFRENQKKKHLVLPSAMQYDRPTEFKNGGVMKCLKGGKTYTECKKCGGKTPIVKDQHPAGKMGEPYEYYRPKWWEQVFQKFSRKPKYPRRDDLGTISGEIRHNGDTVTTITAPSRTFTETRTPDGERYIDVIGNTWTDRTYAPNSSSKGFNRKPADDEVVEMFDGVRKRFK